MKKKYYHRKLVEEVAKQTNLDPKVVHLIIRKFYDGVRKLLMRNEEVNIQGFFTLTLRNFYKKKILSEGKNFNLRKRKDQKTYPKKTNK